VLYAKEVKSPGKKGKAPPRHPRAAYPAYLIKFGSCYKPAGNICLSISLSPVMLVGGTSLGRRRARLDNGLIIPNDHSLGTLVIGLCASCTSTSAACDTKASLDGSAADPGHQIRA
jgi:hypothetical protein